MLANVPQVAVSGGIMKRIIVCLYISKIKRIAVCAHVSPHGGNLLLSPGVFFFFFCLLEKLSTEIGKFVREKIFICPVRKRFVYEACCFVCEIVGIETL